MSDTQIDASAPVLTPGVGYAIVLGMGLGFSALMLAVSTITTRYTTLSVSASSEEYTSASRSLKPGLIASGIVSAATWAATLLQSSTVALAYGVSGPWWYAAGSSTQIMAFAQNAIQLKRNAPGAHTFLEVIGVRWGTLCHLSFMFFGLGTNIILTSQLITGGSNTVNVLTGMNTIAACFLIPIGVVIYTLVGGLRATFFSDYIHTVLIFIIILAFGFSAFSHNDYLGSPSRVYDLLQEAAINYPIAGNALGSYTTFRSESGLVFGIIVMVSGFATVYMDQTYWQRAVASKASTSVKGYILGGFSFLPVPYAFATAAGLAIVAMSASPESPFQRLSPASYGLAAPAAATALLGESGAVLLLIVLFLAVTSAASAELVAVSSIVTYDIYKRYFNPKATDAQILWVSHASVVGFGIFMGVLGVIFYEIGISLPWLYGFTGVFASSGVVPVGLCLRSRHANKWGCLAGLWVGFACGIAAWLVTAKGYGGAVDIINTGGAYEQLAGNAGSFFISAIISGIWSYLSPENFDFEITRRMNAFIPEDADVVGEGDVPRIEKDEDAKDPCTDPEKGGIQSLPDDNVPDEKLYADFRLSVWLTIGLFVLLCIFMPCMMVIPKNWSKNGFTFWVVLSFLWTFVAAYIVIICPVWESRSALWNVCRAIFLDLTGQRRN
ncbi:solute symporter family transporter [Dendrothele bispora CBS 962.96]|uniref:Solute symporter family transporter n=1 Tax=Dendrothele bispora (strain CBS 962.96) TaxID=1314807 RepID=A0A4S8MPD5_DENBC|nr:solute symporter family transporter [Dendrothele bispora CBS 962.96]